MGVRDMDRTLQQWEMDARGLHRTPAPPSPSAARSTYDIDHRLNRVAVQVRFRDVKFLQDALQSDEAARRRGEIDSILVEEFHGG